MAADDGYPGGWLSSGLIRMIGTAPRGSPPQVNHGIQGIGISACLIWVAALSEGCVPYGHESVAPRPAGGVTEARLLARCDAIPSDQTRKGMHTRRFVDAHAFVVCVHVVSFTLMLWTHVTETIRREAEEISWHMHSRRCRCHMRISVCAEQSDKEEGKADRQADGDYQRRVDFGLRNA